MTRILHISDLHFGAVNTRLLEPLLELARHMQPDAIIVSGDLTNARNPGSSGMPQHFLPVSVCPC